MTAKEERFDNLLWKVNFFNGHGATTYIKGDDTWMPSYDLFNKLPKDCKLISFALDPAKVEMEGFSTLPKLTHYPAELDRDILVVDHNLELVRFCPKAMLQFFWQINKVRISLPRWMPGDSLLEQQMQRVDRLTIDESRLMLDKFRPNSGF
ncbi:MAG: hypothetical protein UT24_C0033G0017 [Candidatus Woesebacteria bacterium GW2011_GWB1_39_12]|uniref:Uncharacterized protein n=1 Tax=Candidatus Woesebacteria bacterium GW2011_GWB1_39_12 TaxID=1618574 RepID=A0A0G0M6K7_9BACT|nr:MAG: hypothetical protein UT24_C0033G0017 [Candidatus Woesebacteria bacterium GW2011_GWB1_39_12]